jgi:hypothetical protein
LLKQQKEREEQRERELQQAKENSTKKEEVAPVVALETPTEASTPNSSTVKNHVPADEEEPPVPEAENEETVGVSLDFYSQNMSNMCRLLANLRNTSKTQL